MAIDHATLGTHISSDPDGRGFAAHVTSGDDQAIADILNLPRSAANRRIRKSLVPSFEVFEQFDLAEWKALPTGDDKDRLDAVMAHGGIDVSGDNTRAVFADNFVPGSTTRDNLLAFQDRDGSDLEALFAPGDFASAKDVAIALGRT